MLRRNLNFTFITEVLEIGILSSRLLGLTWWSSGKEFALLCRGRRFDSWSGY